MAFLDDFTVAVNGDIRHSSGTATYTVLEMHRALQSIADDQYPISSDDLVAIFSDDPSERATDNIITLNDYSGAGGPTYNIDATAAEYLYDGSVTQRGGDERYSGLVVVGSVPAGTELVLIQNGAILTSYWGTGLNAVPADNILLRLCVLSRADGVNIDGARIRVQAREQGDTFAEFNATLGLGNSTAAIFTGNDLNYSTTNFAGWSIPATEGYQLLDVADDGSANEPYYLTFNWVSGSAGVRANDVYEYWKEQSIRGSSNTIFGGLDTEIFHGLDTSWTYTGTDHAESVDVGWGTYINTGAVSGGPFTVGEVVNFGSSLAKGRVLFVDTVDTSLLVALESGTPTNGETVTGASSGASATLSAGPSGATSGGGVIRTMAVDTTGNELWGQVIKGTAPSASATVHLGSDLTVTHTVTTPTAIAVNANWIGSSTGTALIGGKGIAMNDSADTTQSDSFTPLNTGTPVSPPNFQNFTVSGCVVGEDYVLVTNDNGSTNIDVSQMTVDDGPYVGASVTAISVGVGNIPADTPATGTIRVERADGTYSRHAYTGYDNTTTGDFTVPSFDASTNNVPASANVYVSYIDKLATVTNEEVSIRYNAPRTMFVRVRDGGTAGDNQPIKGYETTAAFGSGGGGATVTRTSDA